MYSPPCYFIATNSQLLVGDFDSCSDYRLQKKDGTTMRDAETLMYYEITDTVGKLTALMHQCLLKHPQTSSLAANTGHCVYEGEKSPPHPRALATTAPWDLGMHCGKLNTSGHPASYIYMRSAHIYSYSMYIYNYTYLILKYMLSINTIHGLVQWSDSVLASRVAALIA